MCVCCLRSQLSSLPYRGISISNIEYSFFISAVLKYHVGLETPLVLAVEKTNVCISYIHLPFRVECLLWQISYCCGKQLLHVNVTPCLHATACAT